MQVTKKDFITFLKYRNVYENFLYYFNKPKYWGDGWIYICRKCYHTDINEYFSFFDSGEWIVQAFSWRLTNEGYDYWHMLSKDWDSFLKKMKANDILFGTSITVPKNF